MIFAPFAGGFESSILRMGFVDVVGVVPTIQVTDFMTMSFYLFDILVASTMFTHEMIRDGAVIEFDMGAEAVDYTQEG